MAAAINNGLNKFEEKDRIITKAPFFNGENFEYWKDRLESFFLGFNENLWDMVIDGYTHPTDDEGKKLVRKSMTDSQKKEFQNHHTAKTIMLNAISYNEYEKITNRETAHNIFESLNMSHEGKFAS